MKVSDRNEAAQAKPYGAGGCITEIADVADKTHPFPPNKMFELASNVSSR